MKHCVKAMTTLSSTRQSVNIWNRKKTPLISQCYKIFHKLVNVPFDQFFKLTQHNSTRGHSLKLFYPDSRITARAHFFSVRVILTWNRLPAALVQEKNLSVFKSMLRTFDFSYTLLGKL